MRKNGFSLGVACALIATSAVAARADDLPGVYGTGVDDAGLVLARGSVDPHWQIVAVPAGTGFTAPGGAIVAKQHSQYLTNDLTGGPGSKWVGTSDTLEGNSPAGDYVFRTTIDLTGYDPATAVLTGRLAVDDSVIDVVLNGTSLGSAGSGFGSWTAFTVPAGFQDGLNVLDLVVRNGSTSPSGLRVELAGTADLLPVQTAIEVEVDVQPFRDGDGVHPSRPRLPVAVYGSDDIDVTTIDVESITLAGASIATNCDGDLLATVRDVNDDGVLDLLMVFVTADLGLPDEVGSTVELELAGLTTDGIEILGSDTVEIVSCSGFRSIIDSLLNSWATTSSRGRGRGHHDHDAWKDAVSSWSSSARRGGR